VGALAEVVLGDDGDELSLRAVVASPDGAVTIRRSAHVPLGPAAVPSGHLRPPEPEAPPDPGTVPASRALEPVAGSVAAHLGRALAEQMLEDGAADLMPVPAGTVAPRAGTGDELGGPSDRTNGRATAGPAVGLASEEGL
jgi:hydroxymethylbilane synthase